MTDTESNAGTPPSSASKSARSAPPIIDLAAEEITSEQPSSEEGRSDSVSASKKTTMQWIGAALAGSLIGGALVAGILHFVPAKDNTADRLVALETTIGQLGSQTSIKLLETRLAKAESSVSDLRRSLEQTSKSSPELTARLNTIEEALGHINVQAASSEGTFNKATLRLTLAMLIRDEVAKGFPFEEEYKALVTLAGPSSSRAILEKFSKSGLVSYDALAAELVQTRTTPKPIDDTASPASISFNDRVLNMLSHVVTITPADQTRTGTKTNFTEIETAITNHEGSKAFERWQALPVNDKQALAPWASHLQEKLEAAGAADALINEALHALELKGVSQ
jgi:hypothetical protein